MLQLTKDDFTIDQQTNSKQEAIKKIAQSLTDKGLVEEGYVDGMLEREGQAATYLGSGIAIPHGTPKTRHLVKKTGVFVYCFPNGVEWGDDGEKAYIAIGIAASSDEHLSILRQLTHVLGSDDVEERIHQIKTVDDALALLTGKESATDSAVILDENCIRLDIEADNLAYMQALNGAKLKALNAVSPAFLVDILDKQPHYLGQGVWISDSVEGNLKNAVVITRTKSNITENGLPANMLFTISAKDDGLNEVIAELAKLAFAKQLTDLLHVDAEQLVSILKGHATVTNTNVAEQTLSEEFIITNPNGLHTRPSSVLVKLIKEFNSKVTITNLDASDKEANGTSLMKVVSLGAKKGSRLKFTATGVDAKQTLEAIGKAIAEGLGEGEE
ncbi:fused PTS fructose transporter subunit IIA/HPr protein [Orbaceae bacterium ac157xtp]